MPAIKTHAFKPQIRRIVSADGEGKSVANRHAYTQVCAADDRGYRAYIEHDGSRREARSHGGERYVTGEGRKTHYHADDKTPNYGLPTKRILDFLLDIPRDKSDLVISFSFTYDVTKILHDLPWAALCEFADNGWVLWEGYLIEGIPRKYFDVSKGNKRVRVWDTFSYWQMSFAAALDSSLDLFPSKESRAIIDNIKRMKLEREHFDMLSEDEIREYCFNECEFLSILYRDFLTHIDGLGYTQHNHFGPGSVASAFFTDELIKRFMPDGNPSQSLAGLPVQIAIKSYYGGRFEISAQGIFDLLHEKDIQSAYPSIAVKLPCLKHGRFRQVTDFIPDKWGFYYVGSKTTGPWAPFPFRANSETAKAYLNYGRKHESGGKGSIAFVHGGRRWVTADEVKIARNYFGKEAIPIYDGWVFEPGCNHKPFNELVRMYLRRKIGDPTCIECVRGTVNSKGKREFFCPIHSEPSAGLSKVIKLIINSVYGKLCQGIGWKINKHSSYGQYASESYQAPEFQCYIWAAWITGGTRALVLKAALIGGRETDCPDCHSGEMFRACERHSTVKSIATDGILSTAPISELHEHDYELGSWEYDKRPDAWLGMPGIYSFKDIGKTDCEDCVTRGLACNKHASAKKFKRRGLDSKYFPARHLREQWERGLWNAYPIGDPNCPACQRKKSACPDHPIRAFMPLRLAVTRVDGLETYGEWIGMRKVVRFRSVEHKRNYPEIPDEEFLSAHAATIPLSAITIPDDIRSEPYKPKQSWADVVRGRIDDPDVAMYYTGDDDPDYDEVLI